MGKLNIKEAFSKMSKFQLIATILLLAAVALFVLQFFVSYIIDIIWNNYFRTMFASFYNFCNLCIGFIIRVVDIAIVAGLALSMLVGSKKNFAVLLIIKAAVALLNVMVLTPGLVFLFNLVYPNGRIGYGDLFFNYFIQIALAAAYCLLAVLLLGGFKKLVKILGFAAAGAIALISIRYIVIFFTATAALPGYFAERKVSGILKTFFADWPNSIASVAVAAALVLIALGFTFAVIRKSAKKDAAQKSAE